MPELMPHCQLLMSTDYNILSESYPSRERVKEKEPDVPELGFN